MKIRHLLPIAAAFMLFPSPAHAQGNEEVCKAIGNLEVGNWAKYSVAGTVEQDTGTVRFAVVAEEPGEGIWYEFDAETNQGSMVLQMLIPDFPFEPSDVIEVVVQAPGQPPMRLPENMLSMMQQQMGSNPMIDFSKTCGEANVLGKESVSVPAGTFDAWHIQAVDDQGDAWVAPDIPFGLIRGVGKDGSGLELLGYGDDAESSLEGEVQDMPTMPGMPGNP